jgi:hypothetical protein
MTYLMNIRCVNTEIVLITKDEGLRATNVERLKLAEAELPYYLRQRSKADSNNTEGITVRSLGNTYKGLLPNKSPKMALNVGRGLTAPIFHIDEGSFLPNIGITLPAALSAGTAARDAARRSNSPYGTIITTTAGKKDDRDGKYMYQEFENSMEWTEKLMDSTDQAGLWDTITRNSPKGYLSVNCSFNHRQLGYTDEWLMQAIRESRSTGQDAERDYLCKWTSGSLLSPIPYGLTDVIRNGQEEPKFIQMVKGYVVRWYVDEADIPRVMSKVTILAIDPSDASGGDEISLLLVSGETGEVLAASNYNESNLILFSEYLYSWFTTYPKLISVIERRSTGSSIIDYLLLYMYNDGINPYKRLFNRVANDFEDDRDKYKEINHNRIPYDVINKHKKAVGFSTSGSGLASRSDLYSDTLQSALKITGGKLKDKKLIDQLLSLEIRNNRVDHPEGGHDDMVIAYLLAFFFLTKAKNHTYYGLGQTEALSRTKDLSEYTSTDYKIEHSKREINNIYNLLLAEVDSFVTYKLELELKRKTDELNSLSDSEILTYAALRSRLEEDRKSRLRY